MSLWSFHCALGHRKRKGPSPNSFHKCEDATEFMKFYPRRFNPKDGIDNPAMDIAEDVERSFAPSPRVCMLKKEENEKFGFHLRLENGRPGHVIRKVESMGVAEKSGLRDGDRLLEVNEQFVDDLEHTEIARKINMSGPQLCLLVMNGEEYEQAVAQGWKLEKVCKMKRGEAWQPPRLCHITKDTTGSLGLSILPVEGQKGKFTLNPVSGGPAEDAGLRKGDRLVWINGAMACELTHSAISKMLKKCSDHMTVLVVDSESEKSYNHRKVAILPAMAEARNMPYKPRMLHLAQGPEGYGFLLKQEMSSGGRRVHMVRKVDADSPAEKAGFKDGELLLEVNGESIDQLSHVEVVKKIKESGNQVSFTTITLQGLEFYTKLGLSPLLFCEDCSSEKELQQSPTAEEQTPAALKCLFPQTEAKEDLEVEAKPRLCVLQRGPMGFGFQLDCVQQKPGTFIKELTVDGPGERSGLLNGDVLVEVNGQNVEEKLLEDVISLMKNGGSSLSMLVVDMSGYEWMKKNGRTITAENVL